MADINRNIFTKTKINTFHNSRVRYNRAYLISDNISERFNSYYNFGVFRAYNDLHTRTFNDANDDYKEVFGQDKVGTPAVKSLFNDYGGAMIGGDSGAFANGNLASPDLLRKSASGWRISNNVPLMDSPENRQRIRATSGCTIAELVKQSGEGVLGRAIYSYSDFMFCKYLGKIPNNYLITLRRFPIPPPDFIFSNLEGTERLSGIAKSQFSQQIGCMVTWLGTPGNEMENILKYSYTMPYEEKNSQWEQVQGGDADSSSNIFNAVAAGFDPAYRKAYNGGYGGSALTGFNTYIGKVFPAMQFTNGPYDTQPHYDQNRIYGPIDNVKSTYARSAAGLTFDQKITITFDYTLRAYNGINTRQAFLDLISNILQVTYSPGDFWKGGYRGSAMHQNSIFARLKTFQCSGGFTDFLDAMGEDVSTLTTHATASLGSLEDIIKAFKNALNNIGGMFMGNMFNKLGRPVKQYANSLLSEAPVGMWHLTIGNPHHPIMAMGNMVLKNTTITHYGPLGLDDFPTGIKVICELDRGKPRDLREIEKLYMKGNDRIIFSNDQKVIDMYADAIEYNKKYIKQQEPTSQITQPSITPESSLQNTGQGTDESSNISTGATTGSAQEALSSDLNDAILKNSGVNINNIRDFQNSTEGLNSLLQKTFGETDTYSIFFSSAEQEYGAQKRKNKEYKAEQKSKK